MNSRVSLVHLPTPNPSPPRFPRAQRPGGWRNQWRDACRPALFPPLGGGVVDVEPPVHSREPARSCLGAIAVTAEPVRCSLFRYATLFSQAISTCNVCCAWSRTRRSIEKLSRRRCNMFWGTDTRKRYGCIPRGPSPIHAVPSTSTPRFVSVALSGKKSSIQNRRSDSSSAPRSHPQAV
jgi:hypothetical protein